jgi:hypothetical protein
MKGDYVLLYRILVVILAGCLMLTTSGCQKPVVEKVTFGPVFFPPPPGQPRLQFLTAYEGGQNFDIPKPNFLETFVLGESEIPVGTIGISYGLCI